MQTRSKTRAQQAQQAQQEHQLFVQQQQQLYEAYLQQKQAYDAIVKQKKLVSQRVLPKTITDNCLPKKKGPEYGIKIDFDEASCAWRANKLPLENGNFKYI